VKPGIRHLMLHDPLHLILKKESLKTEATLLPTSVQIHNQPYLVRGETAIKRIVVAVASGLVFVDFH